MPKLAQQALTELAVRKAKPADKRYDLFDASVRGLGLRVATEPPPLKWSAPKVRKAEDQRWRLRDLSLKILS